MSVLCCWMSEWFNNGHQKHERTPVSFFKKWERTGGRKRDVWRGEATREEGGRRWMSNIWVLREWRGKKEGTPRLQVWCGRFSDSYNSPAYRISSTQVVLKLCRRAAALSSPKLWQVDLLVLKFVQIRRHSWQTVWVSGPRCSSRSPLLFLGTYAGTEDFSPLLKLRTLQMCELREPKKRICIPL